MSKGSKNWQNVIWREWRNCDDREYTNRLFDLVAYERAGWQATATLILMGILYGALSGLLCGVIATNWDVRSLPEKWALTWASLQGGTWIGAVIGGAGGLLVRLLIGRRLTWWRWLACLVFQPECSKLFRLVGGLVGGIVGGLGGLVIAAFAGGTGVSIIGNPVSVPGSVLIGVFGGIGLGGMAGKEIGNTEQAKRNNMCIGCCLVGPLVGAIVGLMVSVQSVFLSGVLTGLVIGGFGGAFVGSKGDGGDNALDSVYRWGLVGALVGGLVGGVGGALLGGLARLVVGGLLGGLLGMKVGVVVAEEREGNLPVFGVLGGTMTGGKAGLFVGLGVGGLLGVTAAIPISSGEGEGAAFLGLIAVPMAAAFGAFFGGLLWMCFGGLVGGLVSIPFRLMGGLLFGMLVGLPLGVLGLLNLRPDPTSAHEHRFWWFWWRGRPHAAQVEAALRQAGSTPGK